MRERLERVMNRQIDRVWDASLVARDPDFLDAESVPYASLDPYSLALDGARIVSGGRRHVNLFIPSARRANFFAGIRTAVAAGSRIADEAGLPLRVLSYAPTRRPDLDRLRDAVLARTPNLSAVEVRDLTDIGTLEIAEHDVWVATLWGTAHTLDVMARRGQLDRARVIYLVQDFEPAFFPASTRSVLAASTYHAGFDLVVNSLPLASYLQEAEGIVIPQERIFRPELDRERLIRAASERRSAPGRQGVLLYFRPGSVRNMSALGLSALRAVDHLARGAGRDVALELVGEQTAVGGHRLHSYGRLAWDEYFTVLAQADVLVSLQATPHPSHPPLDMVMSGGRAVTNRLGNSRTGLHPSYRDVRADPALLADEVIRCLDEARECGPNGFDEDFLKALGRPLEDVLAGAIDRCATA